MLQCNFFMARINQARMWYMTSVQLIKIKHIEKIYTLSYGY
jgi:hypothetical protein